MFQKKEKKIVKEICINIFVSRARLGNCLEHLLSSKGISSVFHFVILLFTLLGYFPHNHYLFMCFVMS
jgi:hypothetical protein